MPRALRTGLLCAGIFVVGMVVFLAIGVGNLDRAQVYAPGPNPLKAITTIHTAEVQYDSTYGHFAASLQELGSPASGSDTASAAGLIEHDLASGDQGGYKYTLLGTPAGYAISAVPEQYGRTGNRTYFSDQSMGIHVHNGPEPATVGDPLQGETAVPATAPAIRQDGRALAHLLWRAPRWLRHCQGATQHERAEGNHDPPYRPDAILLHLWPLC
jgi:hypothetical protein